MRLNLVALNGYKVKASGFYFFFKLMQQFLSNCQTVSATIWISPSLISFLEMG